MTDRRGFTLIEVLVGLAVAAVAVMLAHATFAAASEASRRISAQVEEATAAANARRLLIRAASSAMGGGEAGTAFAGEAHALSFSWSNGGRISILVQSNRLVARCNDEELVLSRPLDSAEFDYLAERGSTARWLREFHSEVALPAAIRMRSYPSPGLRADTLLLSTGR